jgi:hypothetical protein
MCGVLRYAEARGRTTSPIGVGPSRDRAFLFVPINRYVA